MRTPWVRRFFFEKAAVESPHLYQKQIPMPVGVGIFLQLRKKGIYLLP